MGEGVAIAVPWIDASARTIAGSPGWEAAALAKFAAETSQIALRAYPKTS